MRLRRKAATEDEVLEGEAGGTTDGADQPHSDDALRAHGPWDASELAVDEDDESTGGPRLALRHGPRRDSRCASRSTRPAGRWPAVMLVAADEGAGAAAVRRRPPQRRHLGRRSGRRSLPRPPGTAALPPRSTAPTAPRSRARASPGRPARQHGHAGLDRHGHRRAALACSGSRCSAALRPTTARTVSSSTPCGTSSSTAARSRCRPGEAAAAEPSGRGADGRGSRLTERGVPRWSGPCNMPEIRGYS